MQLPTLYAIHFASTTTKYWIIPTTTGIEGSTEFTPECLMRKSKAQTFLSKPNIDPRYQLIKIKLTAEPEPKTPRKP